MPRKKSAKDSVPNTYDDIEALRKEKQQLKDTKKEVAQERRLLTRERFWAIPRRGQIVAFEVLTLEEVAAIWRFTDTRVCERELRKRGIPIDDEWPGGRKLIATTLLIEKQEEFMRCRSEGMQA